MSLACREKSFAISSMVQAADLRIRLTSSGLTIKEI
jgi:hypothetical protein